MFGYRGVLAGAVCALLMTSGNARALDFVFDYVDAPGYGFNDTNVGSFCALGSTNAGQDCVSDAQCTGTPGTCVQRQLGEVRRAAFEYAASRWGAELGGTVPVEIEVVFFSDIEIGGATAATLRGPVHVNFASSARPDTYYFSALANQLAGTDLDPSLEDMIVEFNDSRPWSYTTEPFIGGGEVPPGYNFVDVALHEIAHGLGFRSAAKLDGTWGLPGGIYPNIFDWNLCVGSCTQQLPEMSQAERSAALTSNNLQFNGPNLVSTYGDEARIFSRSSFVPGTSLSHWDEAGLFDDLLSPFGQVDHDLTITLAVLRDLGWNVACPSGSGVFDPACGVNLDHFKCYKARGLVNASTDLTTTDAFAEDKPGTASRSALMCNPTDVNEQGTIAQTHALGCYKLRDEPPKFSRTDIVIENQFGKQALTVVKPTSLCRPTIESGAPVTSPDFDDLKCYKAKRQSGTAKFARRDVQLNDPAFGEDKTATLLKVESYCSAAGVDGETPIEPQAGLVCYRLRDGLPKFVKREVDIENAFGSDTFKVSKARALCVPSVIVPAP